MAVNIPSCTQAIEIFQQNPLTTRHLFKCQRIFSPRIKSIRVLLTGIRGRQQRKMEDAVDISYYLGRQVFETLGNLDIPLSNGQIVSINLVEELPEDPNELISFLETENCPKKYWISVAQAYAKVNKCDESLLITNKALSLAQFNDSDKLSFHSFRAWLYLQYSASGSKKQEYLQKADEELTFLSKQDASNVSTLLLKAVVYMYQAKAEQALIIFDQLLKIDHNNCFAILGKAHITLDKTKNYANALKLYQQVLVLNPLMKPDPRIGIGLCFWFLKDEEMAVNAWNRALEMDPANIKARLLLALSKFSTIFNHSLSNEEFSQSYRTGLTQLSEIYKENPNDSVILLSLASFYYSKEKYDLVEKIVGKVVQNISGDRTAKASKLTAFQSNLLSHASFWLGRTAYARSDFTQSQKYFHEAIKLNDGNLLAKLGLGQSQVSRGSTEEAIMTYESILKTNPKALEVNYSLGVLYSQHKSKRKQQLAISVLERYLRLSSNRGLQANKNDDEAHLNKEPVALSAYLILSKLYEPKDINQSLIYLNKAVESRQQIGQEAPLEVLNNIGVFNFLKGNLDASTENFQGALNKLETTKEFKSADGDTLIDLPGDLKVTVNFNLARSKELSLEADAIKIYETLLQECPHYFSAKLRLLFLSCVSNQSSTKQDVKDEIEELLQVNANDLEVRSFYGWFVKSFGKKLGMKPDADTSHQKQTLVDHDSHDSYALISLANIYCVMAREIKNSQDDKKKKYYIRAIELFSKVLSLDPKNVYAAQGLAIVYIENKELTKGLDVLRKIRDSLNDISIYLNLGHVLVDLKQFTKAIENFEIALVRFTKGKDSKIFSFLGRAWYLRGMFEKNLSFLKKALDYSEEALNTATGSRSSLLFNLAYIQFQIAEFVSKVPAGQRSVDDINQAIIDLHEAIKTLTQLASDDEKNAPFPKADLQARANLGTNTLLGRLSNILEETKEANSKVQSKLEDAKKLREAEEAQKVQEAEELNAKRREQEDILAKERAVLHEQAQQWAEEARQNVVVEEDKDDELFEAESEDKKKKAKAKAPAKGRKGRKKKAVIEESEEEAVASEPESEAEPDVEADAEAEPEVNGKGNKRKKAVIEDDEEDDAGVSSPKKRRTNKLSKETVDDSDEGLDDDLFNDDAEAPANDAE